MIPTPTPFLETAAAAVQQTGAFLIFGLKPLEFVIAAVAFVAVLFVLVMIHELGHFLAARIIGVDVEEFGFGLPPRLFGKKIGRTIYSLNALPIGGFVRLAGEDEDTDHIDELFKKYKGKHIGRFFWARSKFERAVILVAGISMNLLLAWGITTILVMNGIEEPLQQVKITKVLEASPAQTAGILVDDRVKSIKFTNAQGVTINQPTRIPDELATITRSNLGKEITLIILRNGQQVEITTTPRKDFPEGQGPLGIGIDFDTQMIKYPITQAPFKAVELNIQRTKDMVTALASLPSRALQGQNVQNEVAGPVGIAQVVGLAALIGIMPLLNIMSILSLSLAVLNLLPIPALDGGRLLFVIIEAITGKRVHQGFERRAHQIGMLLLLGFILFVTFNDIARIF